ncbi:hypothetical protein [Aggregatibacter actinomycetemcomitans]|uniref:hypothetical protein n=1 Tax=Aggregatibacter actinomycetemcomitans TaxID=714 RepID=UPI0011DD193C|nr:hypothetical protein [Aggregatibacter actinomycetemcomitans]QEH45637.1 hypothetical protein FXN58_08820 [Aggregatibacter actinomycetemcomitans]QEH49433.1 hypothetical protein FXN57_07180 [Aggregatibacter actinomycetemcomitans]
MMATLKRLVDLSIVSRLLQNPTEYSDIHNGFVKDRAKLRGDFNTTVSNLNRNTRKYGNKKYTG